MNNLSIRITLTDNKGWKETKTINYELYQSEKFLNPENNIIEHSIEDLVSDYKKTLENKQKIKEISTEWRP